jgi:hypothetical protein
MNLQGLNGLERLQWTLLEAEFVPLRCANIHLPIDSITWKCLWRRDMVLGVYLMWYVHWTRGISILRDSAIRSTELIQFPSKGLRSLEQAFKAKCKGRAIKKNVEGFHPPAQQAQKGPLKGSNDIFDICYLEIAVIIPVVSSEWTESLTRGWT